MKIGDRIKQSLNKKEDIIDTLVEIPEKYLLTAEEIAAVQIKEDLDQNKSGKDRPPRDQCRYR